MCQEVKKEQIMCPGVALTVYILDVDVGNVGNVVENVSGSLSVGIVTEDIKNVNQV